MFGFFIDTWNSVISDICTVSVALSKNLCVKNITTSIIPERAAIANVGANDNNIPERTSPNKDHIPPYILFLANISLYSLAFACDMIYDIIVILLTSLVNP
jgi:hypothetical protein